MDQRLVAWARAVKARRRRSGPARAVLWLFVDARRTPDPVAAARALPPRLWRGLSFGLGGVVFRPEGFAAPRAVGAALGRVCRSRNMQLSVAGDFGLAHHLRGRGVKAGLHLRGGRRTGRVPAAVPAMTGSAHGPAELVRARRGRVDLVFLSPVFPTASHPGAPSLGLVRWAAQARRAGLPVGALGGISATKVVALPMLCAAVGGIDAFGAGRSDAPGISP